jgi:hypothetical protein
VPDELRRKLEPPELFHEVLEHRWYLSEREGREVGNDEAVASYVSSVLPALPTEQHVFLKEDLGL